MESRTRQFQTVRRLTDNQLIGRLISALAFPALALGAGVGYVVEYQTPAPSYGSPPTTRIIVVTQTPETRTETMTRPRHAAPEPASEPGYRPMPSPRPTATRHEEPDVTTTQEPVPMTETPAPIATPPPTPEPTTTEEASFDSNLIYTTLVEEAVGRDPSFTAPLPN